VGVGVSDLRIVLGAEIKEAEVAAGVLRGPDDLGDHEVLERTIVRRSANRSLSNVDLPVPRGPSSRKLLVSRGIIDLGNMLQNRTPFWEQGQTRVKVSPVNGQLSPNTEEEELFRGGKAANGLGIVVHGGFSRPQIYRWTRAAV
jgi:hypothetical protein